MSDTNKEHILKVLRHDLANAEDNVARAKMQQQRMPYDHDNNAALTRYELWAMRAKLAIQSVQS